MSDDDAELSNDGSQDVHSERSNDGSDDLDEVSKKMSYSGHESTVVGPAKKTTHRVDNENDDRRAAAVEPMEIQVYT
jgi:hypothetical protein